MITKCEETASIMDCKLAVRDRTGRSVDNTAAVSESVDESDNVVSVASIEPYGYRRHVVPAWRHNLSHCSRNSRVVARIISWTFHLVMTPARGKGSKD